MYYRYIYNIRCQSKIHNIVAMRHNIVSCHKVVDIVKGLRCIRNVVTCPHNIVISSFQEQNGRNIAIAPYNNVSHHNNVEYPTTS